MKVKELIDHLSKHDGELTVIGYGELPEEHHPIRSIQLADTNDPDTIQYDKGDDPVFSGYVKRGEKFLYLIG